jgi:predicted transposase YbfD/YdcC
MVSAWGSNTGLVLGQEKVATKSNEITAIPKLLEVLDIKGCIITIDAMGCQYEIANKIKDNGGDYIFSLKGNQGNLSKDVELFFEDKALVSESSPNVYETVDGDHGRIETRKLYCYN